MTQNFADTRSREAEAGTVASASASRAGGVDPPAFPPTPAGLPPKRCPSCNRGGEWPGQPCPMCKDGAVPLDANSRNIFDPIGLHELATHLRDQRWLDMHVDDERGVLVKRVRLTSIVVRTTDELVSARQEWVDGDDDKPRFSHQDLIFDAEAIWRVTTPTLFDIEGLMPYGLEHTIGRRKVNVKGATDGGPMTDEDLHICNNVLAYVSSATGHSPEEIGTYANKHDTTQARYFAMLLVHDMTQCSNTAIAKHFGYGSVTPMLSAQQMVTIPTGQYATDKQKAWAKGCLRRVKEIAQSIDGGTPKWRREPASSRYVL